MNLLMGLSKMSDNLEELERRMRELERTEASVGITNDGKHPNFDGSYHELMWLQHAGSSRQNLPPRPLATIAMAGYDGKKALKQGLDRYFSNIEKKGKVSAEDALMPFLKGLHKYSINIFGNKTFLEPNAQFTIDKKGFDSPLIESGSTKDAWNIKINGTVIK